MPSSVENELLQFEFKLTCKKNTKVHLYIIGIVTKTE